MNRSVLILCLVLLVAASLALGTNTDPVKETVVDDAEPVAATITEGPDPIRLLLTTVAGEGHGVFFPEAKGMIVLPPGNVDKWKLNEQRGRRLNVWIPGDLTLAIPTTEECQEEVNSACSDAGFGSGSGDATVSDPDEDGCVICGGKCTGGCNVNNECPNALFQFCED